MNYIIIANYIKYKHIFHLRYNYWLILRYAMTERAKSGKKPWRF